MLTEKKTSILPFFQFIAYLLTEKDTERTEMEAAEYSSDHCDELASSLPHYVDFDEHLPQECDGLYGAMDRCGPSL